MKETIRIPLYQQDSGERTLSVQNLYGVSRRQMQRIKKRPFFPEPVEAIHPSELHGKRRVAMPLYELADVLVWGALNGFLCVLGCRGTYVSGAFMQLGNASSDGEPEEDKSLLPWEM